MPEQSQQSAVGPRGMRPADIERSIGVGVPAISPDGTGLVVATSRPDLGADAAVGQLWTIALPDGVPQRLTRGFRDTAPRWSPDGSRIAFLRATRTEPAQLMAIAAGGGEAVAVTDAPLGVAAFDWSPDGTRLAYTAREPERGRYGTVEGLEAGAEPPRRFTTLRYRANGVGTVVDRRRRLFVVDAPDVAAEPEYDRAPAVDPGPAGARPEPTPLTTGDADVSQPTWAPDGRSVLVLGALHAGRDHDLVEDVWRVPLDGGQPQRLTDGDAAVEGFAVDGDRLWTVAVDLGPTGLDFVGRGAALRLHRNGRTDRVTDPDELDLGDAPPPTAAADGVLALRRRRGAVDLVRLGADGGAAVLTSGLEVTAHASAGGRTVVAFAAADTAGELALVEDGGVRVLTSFGRALQEVGLAVPRELTVTAGDGAAVHGWVTVPTGDGPHPVLLMIHGGPFAQYGLHVFDETQVAVRAGYAVVQCNPRGSAGYGQEHARAIRHRMGTVDASDVLDFLDGAITATPGLDGSRVGIMGGSYGGYLTAWTIAHDHRFAAAIVERGFLDPESFVGTSDIGSFFGDEYVGMDVEVIRAQSPQAVVDRVRTPVLVLHSEQDLRCPLPQAERYYAALKRNGVETELLVFPGEDHELTRGGRPRHRVQRFEAVLEWWARHLPVR